MSGVTPSARRAFVQYHSGYKLLLSGSGIFEFVECQQHKRLHLMSPRRTLITAHWETASVYSNRESCSKSPLVESRSTVVAGPFQFYFFSFLSFQATGIAACLCCSVVWSFLYQRTCHNLRFMEEHCCGPNRNEDGLLL
jgi:hypothetical protein